MREALLKLVRMAIRDGYLSEELMELLRITESNMKPTCKVRPRKTILTIVVTLASLLIMTGAGIAENDPLPSAIFDGIMQELVEIKTYKGDVKNHTFFKVDFAILPLFEHKVSDPVIVGALEAGETQDIELEAGDYVFVAFATLDGEFKGHWEHKFRITEDGNDGYGFDIRAGKPTKL